MAILSRGADPEALEASADRFTTYATECTQVRTAVRTVITTSRVNWAGSDLEGLAKRWLAVDPHLEEASRTFTTLGERLRSNARSQRSTSAGEGGRGRSPGPAGMPPFPIPFGPATGPAVPPSYVPPGLLDQRKVDDLAHDISGLGNKDTGMNGNQDDLRAFADRLRGLTPAEADALVRQLSPKDLARLGSMLSHQEDFLWEHDGASSWDRNDVSGNLLSKVSPDLMGKIQHAMPWAQPAFDSTDVVLDGQQSQTQVATNGIHYGVPTGDLGLAGLSARDVNQGQFGDCWAIASLTATTQADPGFVRDSFRPNDNGTISVRIFDHGGDPRWVTVSKDLPLDANGNVVGAHGTDGQLWPAYYEKAFAQVYDQDDGGGPSDPKGNGTYDRTEQGSYGAIEWDFNDKAPPFVTGDSAHSVDGFDGAKGAFAHQQGVIVATPDKPVDGAPDGWVSRHVFYVQSVSPTGDEITLGNPWGPNSTPVIVTREDFDKWFNNPQSMSPKK